MQRKLVDILEASSYDPKAEMESGSKVMDGTLRGMILLIQAGLMN